MQCDVNRANLENGIEQWKCVYLASRHFTNLEEQSLILLSLWLELAKCFWLMSFLLIGFPPPLPPKKGPNKLDSRNSPCHIWGVSLSEVYANVKTFLRSISGIVSLDKVLLLKNYTLTTTSSSSIETEGECGRQPCSYKSFKRKMSVSRETRTISMLKFVWGIRVSTFSLFFFFSLVLVFVFFPLEDFMWADII